MKLIVSLFAVLSTVPALHPSLLAQEIVDDGLNDRMEALNSVLRFRTDLAGDSTGIARCRIIKALDDTTAITQLDTRFASLLVAPDTTLTDNPAFGCAVYGFANAERRVLWLEELTEVTRDGMTALPKYRRKQFEVLFQLLVNAGYREYHRYVVEASGIRQAGEGKGSEFHLGPWRVVEYQLLGWDFHWGDNVGHGSGVRRP